MNLKILLAGLFVSMSIPAVSQVSPHATEGGFPLAVGVGYSNFDSDWNGRLGGPSIWVNWNIYRGPSLLRGFGIEAEGRDLNYNRTGGVPNLREDSALGGPIYTWRHYRKIQPYAKALIGIGSIDFKSVDPNYSHDTRTVYAPGGGVNFHMFQSFWVRGDYEYQFWPNFIHQHALNPEGFTIGAYYDFHDVR
jgi:hypothetical protein